MRTRTTWDKDYLQPISREADATRLGRAQTLPFETLKSCIVKLPSQNRNTAMPKFHTFVGSRSSSEHVTTPDELSSCSAACQHFTTEAIPSSSLHISSRRCLLRWTPVFWGLSVFQVWWLSWHFRFRALVQVGNSFGFRIPIVPALSSC